MTKYIYSFIFFCLLLSSCQSLEQLSIDYMIPAEISFPPMLKRVAIVNNMPDTPNNQLINQKQDAPKTEREVTRLVQYYNGNPVLATESLAQAIADENYFDEVIICDSALRSNDITPREATLSMEEVDALTQQLKVDFLIAIENIQMKAIRKIESISPYNTYLGTTDLAVYPTVRIYVPNRSKPIASLTPSDSIFWENVGIGIEQVRARLIKDEDLIKEASIFAGTIPVKHLLPYWTTERRYFFTGGSVNMRDAAIYVKEKNWLGAVALWEKEYNKKKGKQKMYAAYNLALGYEMQDSIQSALSWAQKAQAVAAEIDQVEQKKTTRGVDASSVPNYLLTSMYVVELEKRQASIHMLDMQMGRFRETEK